MAELCKTRPTSTIHPWQLALVFSSSSRYPRAKPMPPTKSTPRVDGLPTGVKVSGSKMWHWYLRSHRWTGGKLWEWEIDLDFQPFFVPQPCKLLPKSTIVFLFSWWQGNSFNRYHRCWNAHPYPARSWWSWWKGERDSRCCLVASDIA